MAAPTEAAPRGRVPQARRPPARAPHRPASDWRSSPADHDADAARAGARVAWEGRPVLGLWPAPIDWGRVTEREREIFEIGFMNGFFSREEEVAQATADADRLYRVAFDRQQPRRRW